MFAPLLLIALLLGPPRVALSVSPRFIGLSEAYNKGVRVTITIEPNEANRAYCIVWESDNESGSDCGTIEGADFPRHVYKTIKLSHSGSYDFAAVLQGTDKRIQTPIEEVEVS